jgi:hypothetical protein
MLNHDMPPRTPSILLNAAALAVALSACRTNSPGLLSPPRPVDRGEAMVTVTVVWMEPSKNLRLLITESSPKSGGLVLVASENGNAVSGRLAIPDNRGRIRYTVLENAENGRWQKIDDNYSCDGGGAIRVDIHMALVAGDRLAFHATYDLHGCHVSAATQAGHPETLPLLEAPVIPDCCSEPSGYREGE